MRAPHNSPPHTGNAMQNQHIRAVSGRVQVLIDMFGAVLTLAWYGKYVHVGNTNNKTWEIEVVQSASHTLE